jgi:hypothetical protein
MLKIHEYLLEDELPYFRQGRGKEEVELLEIPMARLLRFDEEWRQRKEAGSPFTEEDIRQYLEE